MRLILALLTAHVIADFILQSGFREARNLPGTLGHLAVHSGTMAATLWGIRSVGLINMSSALLVLLPLAVGVLHALQDTALAALQRRWPQASGLTFFTVDQGVHAAVLLAAGRLLTLVYPQAMPATAIDPAPTVPTYTVLYTLLLAAMGTGVAAVLIARLLAPFEARLHLQGDDKSLPQAGLWIGLCERFLLIIAIASGSDIFPSVGLVLTAKSIFRFKELDNRAHAEYYLLGSLLSISVAVLVGMTLRLIYTEGALHLVKH